jgi:putative protease
MADVGCRNTVFGAEAQEASRHLDEWRAAGLAHFRLEFAHESGQQVQGISGAFADCLAGHISALELGQELRRLTPNGTTEGSLFVPQGYQQLPILQ